MFKVLVFLIRKPGMTPEAFRDHYETRHVPLALATFPELVEHRRNYPGENGSFFAPDVTMPAWDAISEMRFADRAGFDAMLARIADPVASAEISADELRFLDRPRCGMMIVEEMAMPG